MGLSQIGSEVERVMPGPLKKVRPHWQQGPEFGPRPAGKAIMQLMLTIMKRTKICLIILTLAASARFVCAGDANENWDKNCKKCHGADGKGQTAMGKKLELKDLTDAKYQASFTDAQATKAIKEGIKDGDKTKMKAAEGLSDDDIKALVAKCRSFKS